MKKSMLTLCMSLFSSMVLLKESFAGDRLFDFVNTVSDKPNTGDSNTMIIYGSLAIVALIVLIMLNVKDSKKKNNEENNIKDNTEDNTEE